MRIAQIAPLAESVPPKLYGGTERVVSWLTEDLVNRGHQVTLFASADSRTSAELVPVVPRALRLDARVKDCQPYNMILVDRVLSRSDDFDMIHFHVDLLHYPAFRHLADKTLTTLHGRLDLPDLYPFYSAFPELPLVSISHAQRRPMPRVNWAGNVYHGLPVNLYQPHRQGGDYLAFVGRVCKEKGILDAIEIAERAQTKLKIGAKVDPVDRSYFEEIIRPRLSSPYVEFLGEVGDRQKNELIGGARAVLFPIAWPEPFGLVMVEAMACGTPVVAFNCGSVPEVLENGVTGFVVNAVDEAMVALDRIEELDRVKIRRQFEQRFTVERMTSKYLEVYNRMLDSRLAAAAA